MSWLAKGAAGVLPESTGTCRFGLADVSQHGAEIRSGIPCDRTHAYGREPEILHLIGFGMLAKGKK